MDNKKICFIMCSNDEFLANECLIYIEQLTIPEGFCIETMVVRDAKSMASGYNYAMSSSDAKYKIYLHQDVLLINKNMLSEIVNIFTKHPEVGMLGVVGNTCMPEDCCPWSDGPSPRIGEILGDLIYKKTHCIFAKAHNEYQSVIVLDGLFMATQYDIPWREDLFKGWDFYDCSQSIEFWQAGYQVVVPYMENPWCLHDNDISNLENYEPWRILFKNEYGEFCQNWNANLLKTSPRTNHAITGNDLDEHKMDFIICYNNELYLQECINYISALKVPDNIKIDILSILDASSMASGYNAAMQSSNAKYKVYLHQDIFILNENFISDVIDTFSSNPDYGMLGVIGTDTLIEDACYWNKWNIGLTYTCNALNSIKISGENPTTIKEVYAVDGMIMITQYDIPWREDIFNGFDFYDISQCTEFIKYGYKVGVPHQDAIWCMHDCGGSKFNNYNYYRELFCNTYKNWGYQYKENNYLNRQNSLYKEAEGLIPTIENFVLAGDIISAQKILFEIMQLGCFSTQICYLCILCNIILLETDSKIESIFTNATSISDFTEELTLIKFALRRLEYDKSHADYIKLLQWLLQDSHKPFVALQEIIEHFIFDQTKVINKLSQLEKALTTTVFEELLSPLVSVIVSVYNAENVIEDTLRSVMQQSYGNLQIIVVDDCSTDKSREIIDKLADEDNRIERLYLPKNSHICKASNEGYKLAKGTYIALIGHDDIWRENKIEKQVQFMELNFDYAASFTLCDIINDNGEICNEQCNNMFQTFNQNNNTQEEWINYLYFETNVFCAPSAMIRKEYILGEHLYQFGLVQLQDYALWLDLLIDHPIYILKERLTCYRQFLNNNSNLSTQTPEKVNRLIHEGNYLFKRYLDKLSDEKYIKYFHKTFVNPNAKTHDELKCEKAFTLLRRGSYYCLNAFFNLLEADATRTILENTYNFSPIDFYKISKISFSM